MFSHCCPRGLQGPFACFGPSQLIGALTALHNEGLAQLSIMAKHLPNTMLLWCGAVDACLKHLLAHVGVVAMHSVQPPSREPPSNEFALGFVKCSSCWCERHQEILSVDGAHVHLVTVGTVQQHVAAVHVNVDRHLVLGGRPLLLQQCGFQALPGHALHPAGGHPAP